MDLRSGNLLLGIFAAVVAVGCSVPEQSLAGTDDRNDQELVFVELPDLGSAPEIDNEIWLNTPEPLRIADLRGKVVLLEFWTFG